MCLIKGKLRSLIEIKEGRFVKDEKGKGNPCNCGEKSCPVCAVFGTSAANRPEDLGPTRIVVRDAHLSKFKDEQNSKSWEERFKEGDLPLEIKYENSINRITGAANPRPLERVPAGVEFKAMPTLIATLGETGLVAVSAPASVDNQSLSPATKLLVSISLTRPKVVTYPL